MSDVMKVLIKGFHSGLQVDVGKSDKPKLYLQKDKDEYRSNFLKEKFNLTHGPGKRKRKRKKGK